MTVSRCVHVNSALPGQPHRIISRTFRLSLYLASVCSCLLFVHPAGAQSWGQYKQLACEAAKENHQMEAQEMWQKALAVARNDAPGSSRYVQSVIGLAQAYCDDNKFEQAEPLFKELVEMKERGISAEGLDSGLSVYADKLQSLGRAEEAARLREKLTGELREKPVFAADPSAGIRLLIRQGDQEFAANHIAKAEQCWQQALSRAREQDSDGEPVAECLNKLIKLYYSRHRYDLAEPYYRASLDIIARKKGKQSLPYLDSVMGHAQLLRILNRKSEAMTEEAKAERTADLAGYIEPTCGSGSGGGSAGASTGSGGGGFFSYTPPPAITTPRSSSGAGYSYNKGREFGALMKQMGRLEW